MRAIQQMGDQTDASSPYSGVGCGRAADVDASGNIVGIEVLGFDEEVLSRARTFASENDLIFPARLALTPNN